MRASDQAIADRLRGMSLEELRGEYFNVFGEEGRGGVEYLRRKIAHALIEAADRARQQTETETEEQDMSTEKKAEQLAIQAIDCENDGDWQGAAEKWAAASLASRTRKKEYEARANACADKAPQLEEELLDAAPDEVPHAPEPDPDAGPHLEHLEAANQAEREGDHRTAIVEWELAAGKAPHPLREGFLARAEQLRELVAPAPSFTPPAAPAPTMADRITEISKVPPIVNKTPPIVNKPPVAVNKEPAERDPRLPPAGTVYRKDLKAGGFVEVVFHPGPEVGLTAADADHAALVGQTFASVSGLARAYCGRNTNGYVWLGLKEGGTPGAPVTVAKAAAERLEQPLAAIEAVGPVVVELPRAAAPDRAAREHAALRPSMEERAREVVEATIPRGATVARTPARIITAPAVRQPAPDDEITIKYEELEILRRRSTMVQRPLLEEAEALAAALCRGFATAEIVQRMLHAEAARRVAAVYGELANALEKV